MSTKMMASVLFALACVSPVTVYGKAFPTIPDSYTTELEMDDLSHNRTVTMWEAFDYDSNRFRVTVSLSHTHRIDMYFDENEGKAATVVNRTHCTVRDIVPGSSNGFGGVIDFKEHHIKHPSAMMHLDAISSNATYLGESVRRGIMCDGWRVSYSESRGDMVSAVTVTHYFAVESWTFGDATPAASTTGAYNRPVETLVTGTARNTTSGEVYPIDSSYEWVRMHAAKPDDHLLSMPAFCTAGAEATKFPTDLADDFHTVLEANLEDRKSTVGISEWHDFSNNRARFIHDTEAGRRDDIYRIDLGKHYRVEYTTDAQGAEAATCTESAIDANGRFIDNDSGFGAHLRHTKDMFRMVDPDQFTFDGATRVRGIAADSWSATVSHPSSNPPGSTLTYRLTWSFRSLDWSYRGTTAAGSTRRIPLRAEMSGHRISPDGTFSRVAHSYEFVDWVEGASSDGVFAIPIPCGGTGLPDGVDAGAVGNTAENSSNNGGGGGGGSGGKVAAAVIITMIFSFAAAGVAAYLYVKKKAGTPTRAFDDGQPAGHLVERVDENSNVASSQL